MKNDLDLGELYKEWKDGASEPSYEEIVADRVTKLLLSSLIATDSGLPLKSERLISEAIMLLQSIYDFNEDAGVNSFDMVEKFQHIRTMILEQFGETNGEHILYKP